VGSAPRLKSCIGSNLARGVCQIEDCQRPLVNCPELSKLGECRLLLARLPGGEALCGTPALFAAASMVKPELFLAQISRAGVGLASARGIDSIEYHSGRGDKQEPALVFGLCRKWFVP
jgi:hypothetical protein